MTRLNIPLSLLAVVLLVAGCGSSKTAPTDGEATKKPDGTTAAEPGSGATETIGTLAGPGGTVSLGDPPDKFNAAFPRPKDATDTVNPTMPDLTFAGWATKDEVVSAAIRSGKIVAMFHSRRADEKKWFDEARGGFGKPEHDVSNDLGAIVSWKQGVNEHIVMLIQGERPTTIRATGKSETLKALQLDSAQIASSLKAQGEAAAGGHGPDDGDGH